MNKKIYFIGGRISGVGIMRGKQVSDKLNSLGYNSEYRTNDDISDIKNSIVFVLKYPLKVSDFGMLKDNRNTILWDIQDHECHTNINKNFYWDITPFEISDCCIFLNSVVPKELSKFIKLNYVIIPHHWDEKLRGIVSQKNEFNFGYYGNKSSCQYLDLIDSKTFISSEWFYRDNDIVSKMEIINCHCDIKPADSLNFFAKSALKTSTAAAVESNIILNKAMSSIELLDESYPFYTDNTEESFISTIELAKYSFGGKMWNDGLDMLKSVKEKTDLNNVINSYIQLINSV
jgi:hypothetical protein